MKKNPQKTKATLATSEVTTKMWKWSDEWAVLIGLAEKLTCWVLTSESGLDGGSLSGPLETCGNISAHPNRTSKNSRNIIYTTVSDKKKVIKWRRVAEQGQRQDTGAPPHLDRKSDLWGQASLQWWFPLIWLWSNYYPAGLDPGREKQKHMNWFFTALK